MNSVLASYNRVTAGVVTHIAAAAADRQTDVLIMQQHTMHAMCNLTAVALVLSGRENVGFV